MHDPEQSELHDKDCDWWVNDSDGAMGLSGTHGSVMAQLIRGGPGNYSGPSEDDGMTRRRRDDVHRYARIEKVWHRLDGPTRRTLRCYYEHRQQPPGVRTELGKLAGVVMAGDDAARATQAAGYLHPDPTKYEMVDGQPVAPKKTKDLSDRAKAVLSHVSKAALVEVVAAHEKLVAARLAELEAEAERKETESSKRIGAAMEERARRIFHA